MKQSIKLRALTALGIIGISCSGPLVKLALQDGAHPVSIALWRLLFSALLLLPTACAKTKHRHAFKTLSKQTWVLLAISGILLSFHFLFWFISLSLTTTFASTVVLCVQPLFTLLGAYLIWREIPVRGSLLGIFVAMAGVLVLAFSSTHESDGLYGYLYSFISAVCLTGYLLCNKALRHRLALTVHTFTVYSICTVTLVFLAIWMHAPLYVPNARFFLLCLILAIVSTLCGHSVFNYLLKYRSAGTVAALQLGEPVGAAVIAFFLFQEIPSVMVLLGGILILVGILFFTVRESSSTS